MHGSWIIALGLVPLPSNPIACTSIFVSSEVSITCRRLKNNRTEKPKQREGGALMWWDSYCLYIMYYNGAGA